MLKLLETQGWTRSKTEINAIAPPRGLCSLKQSPRRSRKVVPETKRTCAHSRTAFGPNDKTEPQKKLTILSLRSEKSPKNEAIREKLEMSVQELRYERGQLGHGRMGIKNMAHNHTLTSGSDEESPTRLI